MTPWNGGLGAATILVGCSAMVCADLRICVPHSGQGKNVEFHSLHTSMDGRGLSDSREVGFVN